MQSREPRRDARENRERVLEAAVRVFARDGLNAPLATIAAEAGLGVGTLYRSFEDRAALLQELESRAYAVVDGALDRTEAAGATGLAAIRRFLELTYEAGDRMILPLHGAPPLVDAATVEVRQRIDARIERFLDQGRAAGAITSDVNATDVIMCSALITQPLRHGPDWDRSARRHIALFIGGLAARDELPGPPVSQADLERTWALRASGPPLTR